MSVLSRVSAPAATHDLAGVVAALLSNPERTAPRDLPGTDGDQLPEDGDQLPEDENEPAASVVGRLVTGPTGLGTSAARIPWQGTSAGEAVAATGRGAQPRIPDDPTGLGPSAAWVSVEGPTGGESDSELYCPPAVRDDKALGEAVNDRLVDWAGQVGIYPGQLDRVRAANFGRLMMLTHPATDDPDRLLAAAKCVLAEWATDDHFLDEESLGADAKLIGSRLGIAYAAVDPADLPVSYAPQLDKALSEEPVAVAYRSAFEHLAQYATATQVARLRHELSVMYMAYNHEANWRATGRTPPVWEYLTHRHENSFLPPMVLVDPIAGYELPSFEFADRRVRRVFCLAGSASVILNDLYSMAKESDTDFDLPKVIAAEEKCSPQEAIKRTVQIHNELMHTFVEEAAVLSHLGSLALRRFLADIWAWLGGNREWHSTTERYHG
ncbi:MAG: family 2 encapsulin nanocompartment cargo protein terpene cyclase, partial [Pseudonocardiaceae bacterium]